MNPIITPHPLTRRSFLHRGAAGVAGAALVSGFPHIVNATGFFGRLGSLRMTSVFEIVPLLLCREAETADAPRALEKSAQCRWMKNCGAAHPRTRLYRRRPCRRIRPRFIPAEKMHEKIDSPPRLSVFLIPRLSPHSARAVPCAALRSHGMHLPTPSQPQHA